MDTKHEDRNEVSDKEKGLHFFASCGLGWATAKTRDAAVRKCVNAFQNEFKRMVQGTRKRGEIGAYVWSCWVDADEHENYAINFYKPEGVEIGGGENHFVTYITAKEMAYFTEGKK